ncbi:hypothetical protein CGZ91_10130 [Parenemella sanctibonifatiensis]|uniref:Sialidase domain-containing protein n=1 Tax=Parenemella sanctibonifatiensis TaxID=2016505 RepID=A0A255EE84_9ACTN|nr:hypothetical protein CGZ91_10130 [Parenemella sanctibonifatiensis]
MQLSLEVTAGDRLWAAWAAGGDSDWAFTLLARSDDRGDTWSDPILVIDPSNGPELRRRTLVANLWCDPGGRLWFFFDQSVGFFDGRAGVWAIHTDIPDATKPTWSKPQRIWHGAALSKPTVATDGTRLLPVSLWNRSKIHDPRMADEQHELDELRGAHVLASTDEGLTWHRRGCVRFEESAVDRAEVRCPTSTSPWLAPSSQEPSWRAPSSQEPSWPAPSSPLPPCWNEPPGRWLRQPAHRPAPAAH